MSLRVAIQMDPVESIDIRGDTSFALEGETRVAADVDGFDRVHLDGNAKRHVPGSSPAGRCEA